MLQLQSAFETQARGLLRILFFWRRAVPAGSRSAGERSAIVLLLIERSSLVKIAKAPVR